MEQFLGQAPMKYWAVPTKSKDKYKQKVIDAINTGKYLASTKKDGEWSRFIKAEDGTMYLQGRGVSTVTGTHLDKSYHVPHIIDELGIALPVGTVLLGELFYEDGDSSDVSSILRCLPKKAIKRQNNEYGKLFFYMFDILAFDSEDMSALPAFDRTDFLMNKIKSLMINSKYCKIADFTKIETYAQLESLVHIAFANDEEGIVCTDSTLPYLPGKRKAWSSIKFKRESAELDVVCTSVYEPTLVYSGSELNTWQYWAQGEQCEDTDSLKKLSLSSRVYEVGNSEKIFPVTKNFYYNMPSAIGISVYDNGKLISIGKVASGLNEKIKLELGKNPDKFIKMVAVVSCMQITDENKLRHPRFIKFRTDIPNTDCTLDKIIGDENE